MIQQVSRAKWTPIVCRPASSRGGKDVDAYLPQQDADGSGIYRPIRSLTASTPPAVDVAAQSRELARRAWEQLAVASTQEGRTTAPQIQARDKILGHPRINRPYPDPALQEAGVAQDLPLDIPSKFKWLMSEPLVLGEKGDVVLLHAQFEGGPTWLEDGEYECRDFFIAVRRDPESGRYREAGSLMTRKPGFQEVFRRVGPVQAMPDKSNQFMIHLEEGSYNYLWGHYTHLYEVTPRGIEQAGCWEGHLSAEEIRSRPPAKSRDERALANPSPEALEAMNYSRNWQDSRPDASTAR